MGRMLARLAEKDVVLLARASTNNRDKAIFSLLFETSCKTKDLVEIKFKDIKNNSIKINEAEITLSEKLLKIIKEIKQENNFSNEDYLFSSRQSEKITTKRIRQIIQKNTKLILGFEVNPEEFRKSSIVKKISEKPIEEVKKEVGLKRLDKRKYISEKEIKNIRKTIYDEKRKIIFDLLCSGIKSSQIASLTLKSISQFPIDEALREKITKYSFRNDLSNKDILFLSRQKTELTKERIFQIIKEIGENAKVEINPQTLNNSALSIAISNLDETKLSMLVKTRAFHLQGGLIQNEI